MPLRALGRKLVAAIVVVIALFAIERSAAAQAKLPRDFFLDPPRAGTHLLLDAYFLGVQGSLEQRWNLDGDITQLVVRGSAITSFPYAEGTVHADLRSLFFQVGATAGYRYEWQNYTFDLPEERAYEAPMDRHYRSGPFKDADRVRGVPYGYAEARARLTLPLEMFFFSGEIAYRHEDRPDGRDGQPAPSFDWWYSTVYDAGGLIRGQATLFLRHPKIGAIGPTIRVLDLPRGGRRDTELGYGFTAGTRPGWRRNRDTLLLNVVAASPEDEYFGNVYGRFYFILLYRAEIKL
jgi:hypothetical protein